MQPADKRNSRRHLAICFTTMFVLVGMAGQRYARGQVLVGNPFITSYDNWIDPDTARGGNWRLSLHNPVIMETSDLVPTGSNPPAANNNGSYNPTLLIQNNYTTPANYDLNARMYTSDDDGFGLVFGYQDINNYFRAFFRAQGTGAGGVGNLGGTPGTSIQKVVGGVVTQISPNGTAPGNLAFPTLPANDANSVILTHAPIDVKVSVTGNTANVYVAGVNGDMPLATITDAALLPGKIGIQSWAQRNFITTTPPNNPPHWGTEVESISVTQGVNTLYSGTFNQATSLPVTWRQVVMKNSNGLAMNATGVGEDKGNWGVDINSPYIYQQTNGFEYATTTAPNVDFLSTAVAVNTPGSTSFTNYEMRVRIGTTDDDGLGVLLRVQDDDNFYRINFSRQSIVDATNSRAPGGMSIQKVRNGVWTEIFRDDQGAPLFTYQNGTGNPDVPTFPMFDLKVGVVGDTFKVQVRDHLGNNYNYPLIQDTTDPILSGSVGLHTWGTDNVYFTRYGGVDTPLLRTLTSLKDIDLNIDRATGNVTLVNNDPTPVNIKGVSIQSAAGSNNPANWLSIANNYDRTSPPTPGNGSIDNDDAWTILTSTNFNLSEAEQVGNGGVIPAFGSVNLGNLWRKSRLEDLIADLTLTDNSSVSLDVIFSGTPYARADLDTDGDIDVQDWLEFYPNLLTNMSMQSGWERVTNGDLDGDGDNDINDFVLFKNDYNAAHGAGAFEAMLGSVPEPGCMALFVVGACGAFMVRRRRACQLSATALAMFALLAISNRASATAVDLTTFTLEAFPPTNNFISPTWEATKNSVTIKSFVSTSPDHSVFYAPDSALNKRYIGSVRPRGDDDVVGWVLGFEPGDGQINSTADYVLIDWKGATQNFNFTDTGGLNFHHDRTPGGDMPIGLAISRVTGSPTADELWQHINHASNTAGGVEQLARGATLGSAAYNRAGGSHIFDISYTATNVTVRIDGVEQFNINGSFPDGRFGLYQGWQGEVGNEPSFSNIEVVPATGFNGLSANIELSTGEITLTNTGSAPVSFDYYQLGSLSNSLKFSTWNSLDDQNYQQIGGGPGQSWNEAGGSSNSVLAEAFLLSNSTLAGNTSVSLGIAYNNIQNGHDVTLTYRLSGGLIVPGLVTYSGVAPGTPGDFNGDMKVDAADYVLWRRDPGSYGGPGGYTAWRANFGNPPGSGSSLDGAGVPEPTTIALVACVGVIVAVGRQRFMHL